MKKIVAAFDGLRYSESTQGFAIQIAKQTEAHLIGLFLEDISYHSYKIYELIREEGYSASKQKKLDQLDAQKRSAAIAGFDAACSKAGIHYTIHQDRNIAIQELLHESIYADLVIIDSLEVLSHHPEKPPSQFMRDLLTEVQCPVLVVPPEYSPFKNIILLYDGEPSSVFAIKMFSYTFSSFSQLPVKILTVRDPKYPTQVPDTKLMKEFIRNHFPRARFTVLKGEAESRITAYLKEVPAGSIVVLGAYRRSRMSRWFRASMADILLRKLKLPLFIAHNK